MTHDFKMLSGGSDCPDGSAWYTRELFGGKHEKAITRCMPLAPDRFYLDQFTVGLRRQISHLEPRHSLPKGSYQTRTPRDSHLGQRRFGISQGINGCARR